MENLRDVFFMDSNFLKAIAEALDECKPLE